MMSLKEMLIIMGVIALFSMTGLWPTIVRGLRELRGQPMPDDEPRRARGRSQKSDSVEICCRLLGVAPSAPWDEIEKAYRSKAKIHHPDVGGDEDAMRALNEAYSRLKELRRR